MDEVKKVIDFNQHHPSIFEHIQLHRLNNQEIHRDDIHRQVYHLSENTLIPLQTLEDHAQLWNIIPINQVQERLKAESNAYYYLLYLRLTHEYGFQKPVQTAPRVIARPQTHPSPEQQRVTNELSQIIIQLHAISLCSLGDQFVAHIEGHSCLQAPNCPIRKLGRKLPPLEE